MWHVSLGVFNRTLRIATDDEAVVRYAHNAFRRLRSHGSSAPVDHAFVLTGAGEPRIIFRGRRLCVDAENLQLDRSGFAARAVNAVLRRAFAYHAQFDACNGAALSIGAGVVAIAGPAGCGKTALALALLERGARYLSDQFTFIRKTDGLVFPFPRTLEISESTLALFSPDCAVARGCRNSPGRRTSQGKLWEFVDAGDTFHPRHSPEPAPLRGVFVLEHGVRTVAYPLSADVAGLALTFCGDEPSLYRAWKLAERLANVPCYRLTVGDLETAASIVEAATIAAC